MQITPGTFSDSRGLTAGTQLKIRIGGVTNPKAVHDRAIFSLESFNSEDQIIDSSYGMSFSIKMEQVGKLHSI